MDFQAEKERMVNEQILARGIKDSLVVAAFRKVPRHRFVPPDLSAQAYCDSPLPIGQAQTISQPYMVALMTELLGLKGGEKVLEIGTGSGYQAAILAEICKEVITVERNSILSEKAEKTLFGEGYSNIRFVCGDGTKGVREYAPFDAIIVTAGSPCVPEPLKAQLADKGRLIAPVGGLYEQVLVKIRRDKDIFLCDRICSCVFVPLKGENGWPE